MSFERHIIFFLSVIILRSYRNDTIDKHDDNGNNFLFYFGFIHNNAKTNHSKIYDTPIFFVIDFCYNLKNIDA